MRFLIFPERREGEATALVTRGNKRGTRARVKSQSRAPFNISFRESARRRAQVTSALARARAILSLSLSLAGFSIFARALESFLGARLSRNS